MILVALPGKQATIAVIPAVALPPTLKVIMFVMTNLGALFQMRVGVLMDHMPVQAR